MLEARFSPLPEDLVQRIEAIQPRARLQAALIQAATITTLHEQAPKRDAPGSLHEHAVPFPFHGSPEQAPQGHQERFESAWQYWRPGSPPPRWEEFLPLAGKPCSRESIHVRTASRALKGEAMSSSDLPSLSTPSSHSTAAAAIISPAPST